MKVTQKSLIPLLVAASVLRADVNILILGSDSAGDQRYVHTLTQGAQTGTPPFLFEEVATHLREILEGAGHDTVNVTTQNIATGGIGDAGSNFFSSNRVYSSNLMSWFFWPYGEFKGGNYLDVTGTEAPRWANLRGEAGTPWDYVVLLEDPSTIERMPGFYTLGVAKIAEEVAKGSGQTVLLMPWPAPGASSSVEHYKDVVYRTGRSAGIPVAPAGLAWQAAGSPVGATHPSSDAAYIAAATLYSRLFGQSASASSYNVNDAHADIAHTTVQANQGAPQYSGPFASAHPTRMLGDKRRHVLHSNRGTSTENRFRRAYTDALVENRITYSYTRETYNSDTPDDDELGWPYSGTQLPIGLNWGRHWSFSGDGPTKSYFTNPDFWQMGFGFAYQSTNDSVRARGLMAGRDFYVGFLMGEGTVQPTIPQTNPVERADEIATGRVIPVHVLYAQIHREFPTNTFMSDQSHLSRAIDVAAANFMGTLYSGRTFIPDVTEGDDVLPDPVLKRHAQWVGYETAWIVGSLQARAPGLKILPSSSNASAASEQFSIHFLNPPQADVTVQITVSDDALTEVSHESLIFTAQNYSQPVAISSRAKKRNDASNPTYAVLFTTTSDDEVFDGLTDSWSFNMPSNAAPSIDITAPAEGANFPVGSDLTVSVHSADPDGSVAHVTLWVNGTLVRQDSAAPYEWSPALGDSPLANLADDVYELRIQAVDNQGAAHTVTRTITVGTPGTTPPAAPANLTASPAFALVTLDWGDNTEADFLSYSIYRSTTPGSFGSPLAIGLSSSEYIDTTVENDTTYYYAVTATDRFLNESAFSEEVTITVTVEIGSGPNDVAVDFGTDPGKVTVTSAGFTTIFPATGTETHVADAYRIAAGATAGHANFAFLQTFTGMAQVDTNNFRIVLEASMASLGSGTGNLYRYGVAMFADTANLDSGGIYALLFYEDGTLTVQVRQGLNGTILASGALKNVGGSARPYDYPENETYTFEVTGTYFVNGDLRLDFSLSDGMNTTVVSTTVNPADYPGELFGGVARIRNGFSVDFENFSLQVIPADLILPDAPTNLQATPGVDLVYLTWDAITDPDFASYTAYRREVGGSYGIALESGLIVSEYDDATALNDTEYFYVVRAVDTTGKLSGESNEVSAIPSNDLNGNGIDAGLVAYYPFDVDFTDASGNGNHLTAVESGGATVAISNTAGEFVFGGGAANFNSGTGNQAYLALTTMISFGATDAWSVSFWVRRRAGSDDRQGMVLGEVGSTTDFFWASDNSAQVQGMRYRSSANTNANFGGFPDDGAFHHWVLTSDGAGTISAYRNNVKLADQSSIGTINITSIGQAFNQIIHSMNGQIDELRIYDEVLDAAAVATLYGLPITVQLLRVFLIGGQSNAEGRADPAELPTSPVNLQQPQEDIDFYTNSLTTLRPFSPFGPEITMGRRLGDSIADGGATRIAIIKYAVGGTSLSVDWKAGGDDTTMGDGPRYVTFQQRVTQGLAALAAAYPEAVIEIEGMLWVQGERDVVIGSHDAYEANLTAFIADVRATYGEGLPFVISRLSINQTNLDAARMAVIRAAQAAVANSDPRAALLNTDDFGMQDDNLHFDAAGQQQLGYGGAGWLLNFYPFQSRLLIETQTAADFMIKVGDAFEGFVYTLESIGTLKSGDWEPGESKTAAGNTVEFTVTPVPSVNRQFFRVWRLLVP